MIESLELLAVRLGQLEDALAEAARIGLSLDSGKSPKADTGDFDKPRYRDLYMATVVDLLIATRQLKQADAMIEKEFRLARVDGRVARLVDLSLAKLTIATHEINPTKAMKELGSAISWAARRRIVGPFHDRGSVVASVVMAAGPSMRSLAVSEEKEFFAEICRGLPTNNLLLENWSAIWGADEGLSVALTKREVKLLSLLDLGLSNQQVADRSYVSITTIKWHLKNLYRKFGVSTRYAMLARARTLRMISK